MSKMDNLRAMREARYDKAAARAKEAAGTKPGPSAAAPAAPVRVTAAPVEVADEVSAGEELCGHRNMSGRTCTREKGHAAKSHRYS
jgi:hypothetical protein